MEMLTIAEIATAIGVLVGTSTGVAFLLKPWRELKTDVKRLKYAVFGQDLKENTLATKEEMTELSASIIKLADATNLMYRAVTATIESLPETDELKRMKQHLNNHNSIV